MQHSTRPLNNHQNTQRQYKPQGKHAHHHKHPLHTGPEKRISKSHIPQYNR